MTSPMNREHPRIVRLLMANRVEDAHKYARPGVDYSDIMYDPVTYMEERTDVQRTSQENKGGEKYSQSPYLREDVSKAFANRGELRQKYGHIAKF